MCDFERSSLSALGDVLGGAGWGWVAGGRRQEEALAEQVGRLLCHQPPVVPVVGRAILGP